MKVKLNEGKSILENNLFKIKKSINEKKNLSTHNCYDG